MTLKLQGKMGSASESGETLIIVWTPSNVLGYSFRQRSGNKFRFVFA